jgi:hypothetical protein
LRVSEVLNIKKKKEGFEDKYMGLPTPHRRMANPWLPIKWVCLIFPCQSPMIL